MKSRLLGAVCACSFVLPVTANAAFFDFQDWISTNGERGFNNATPFSLTDDGLTLTATAFEQPGMLDSHVYMDDLYNGIIGGMGVCTTLNSSNQCVPSSDDNVSIDGINQETLSWGFNQNIARLTLELGNDSHFDYANRDFQYRYGLDAWFTATTDASGFVTLLLSGDAGEIDFKTIVGGVALDNQFYIRNVDVTVVPLPAAVWLFGYGLLGLVGIARRKNAA